MLNYVDFENLVIFFKDKGLSVKINPCKNQHITVTGSAKSVSLYPTTGTVSVTPQNGKKGFTHRGMSLERAKDRVVSIAKFGH